MNLFWVFKVSSCIIFIFYFFDKIDKSLFRRVITRERDSNSHCKLGKKGRKKRWGKKFTFLDSEALGSDFLGACFEAGGALASAPLVLVSEIPTGLVAFIDAISQANSQKQKSFKWSFKVLVLCLLALMKYIIDTFGIYSTRNKYKSPMQWWESEPKSSSPKEIE